MLGHVTLGLCELMNLSFLRKYSQRQETPLKSLCAVISNGNTDRSWLVEGPEAKQVEKCHKGAERKPERAFELGSV